MQKFLICCAVFCIFLVSCTNNVELKYEKLESKFVNLTPYWEYVIKNNINTDNAVRFSALYKEAQSLILEYKNPARGIGPGGTLNGEDRNDTIILWELNNRLNWASARTNAIVTGISVNEND